ncbi:MAG: hypothetical protein QXG01_06370 [Candidatus Bathyarchaeia archaeon]
MASTVEPKYILEIKNASKPLKVPKESLEELKGVIKGKILVKMKKEAIDCPVKNKTVSFVECFSCKNFLRRIRGKIDCQGLPFD